MSAIHKYVLPEIANSVSTFEGARFVHVANQRDQITVWAEVNTMARECMRTLRVVGTGHDVPIAADYVGSALMAGGDYVFHIYVDREPAS